MLHLLFALIASCSALAAEVAFIEVHRDGKPLQLEPGGRFFHVAIRYRGQWLHAHTYRGVELVDSIREFGDRFVYLRNAAVPEPSPEQVAEWLGKPFDLKFHWESRTSTYCTKLIADLLGVDGRPMTFNTDLWRELPHPPPGGKGLSPDELFDELIHRGFWPRPCEDALLE